MDLSGRVLVVKVEAGDGAGVASVILEATIHIDIALQLQQPHLPGPGQAGGLAAGGTGSSNIVTDPF